MRFHIETMTCGGCARGVVKAIQAVDPTAVVEPDPSTRGGVVTTASPRAAIEAALAQAGYRAETRSAA